MFAAVLFLVAALACASHIDEPILAPDPMLKALFNAFKTGVLEISEQYCVSWLRSYDISLTEESISGFESLLFNESIGAPQYGSEKLALDSNSALTVNFEDQIEVDSRVSSRSRAATSLQDALLRILSGETDESVIRLAKCLAKYALYKLWLHKKLSPAASEMLRTLFSKWPETLRFIDKLTRIRKRSSLLAAFANGWKSDVVKSIWSDLESESKITGAIATLVEEYVEGHEDPVEIPLDLFKRLTVECKYRLAIKLSDLRPYHEELDWHIFYILSRFSEYPSEKIRALCLEKDAKFLTCEGEKVHGPGRLPTNMEKFSLHVLPKEVWLEVLLRLDELSQIYSALRVCKLWWGFRLRILDESPAIKAALTRDLSDPVKWGQILHNTCYPWNRLFGSRLASFKYLVSRVDDGIEGVKEIRSKIDTAWSLLGHDIDKGKIIVSSEFYFDLYVRCCKAIRQPPEFKQLPGVSDEEYVGLVESLVYQYDIVPDTPDWSFSRGCEVLVKMLRRNSNLVILLLRDDSHSYNKLVMYLFITKSPLPQEAVDIIAEKSPLYRLLLDRHKNIGKRFDILPQNLMNCHALVSSHSVIDLCLLLGPEGDATTLMLIREAIIGHFCGPHANEETRQQKLKQLTIDVLMFLCRARKNYSAEDFDTIERVLEKCRIYTTGNDQDAFRSRISSLVNYPQFTIKLIR